MTVGELSLSASPLLPWAAMVVALGIGVVALALLGWLRPRGVLWRVLAIAGLLLVLVNPVAILEERQPLSDVALVVIDDSKSQTLGERQAQTAAAEAAIRQRFQQLKDLDLRVVHTGGGRTTAAGTRLFEAVERALSDVPRQRLSAVLMVTDGQIHDLPQPGQLPALPKPIHTLLTGKRGEQDRRLVVERSPSYGIVGRPLKMTVRVDDGPGRGGTAQLNIRRNGEEPQTIAVPIGTPQDIDFVLDHSGQTVFELEVAPGPEELTLDNNRAVVMVGGVRDRLRVLLVTGEPHPGERTWRNLLKSDPAVDLIHFTILRPPEAQDFTPVSELSLIAFPIRELFEVKLHEFDLVIFDRYRRRDVLAQVYLDNIVRYVRGGGALLVAAGPQTPGSANLLSSPLAQILPGIPTGAQFERGFRLAVTELGHRHPVTADLPGAEATEPSWGRWFRHVDTEARRGPTLMSGVDGRPLLILDRVGDGRVAQLMSDHIWLWARGFEGGGPQAELLRRVAHWLMKEPELEENDLRAILRGDRIEVVRRSLEVDQRPVEVTGPNGFAAKIELKEAQGGRAVGTLAVEESGLYRFASGDRVALAAVGALNPVELADVRATEDVVRVAANATGGTVAWLSDGMPELRRVRPNRDAHGREPGGRQWLGLKANGDYLVKEVRQMSLLPGLLVLIVTLGTLILAWRREGQ